jgi:hypothetical protein
MRFEIADHARSHRQSRMSKNRFSSGVTPKCWWYSVASEGGNETVRAPHAGEHVAQRGETDLAAGLLACDKNTGLRSMRRGGAARDARCSG